MVTNSVARKPVEHPFFAWLVVLTASLFFFYEFIQLNLFNAITVQLMQAFHLNATGLGQLGAMYFWADMLFLIPAGLLLDRYSTKKLLIMAGLFCTTGTFIFALAHALTVAAIGRFLVGMGASFCFLSCIRLASHWFPPRKMAFVTGIIVTMAMLGGLVAQTPLTLLTAAVGWRNALLIDGGLGIFVTLAIILIVKDHPSTQKANIAAAKVHLAKIGLLRSTLLVLLNPNNWLGGIYTLLMNLPVFLLGALWGMHYLVEVHHVSWIQASYATSLFFIGVIIGSPAFGWLSDHLGRRILPMLIGAVLSLFTILVLMFAPNLNLPTLIVLFFTIGFVTSSQILSYPTIAELNPIALTSTAMSIASVMIIGSGAVFQPLFGWLIERHWDHTVINGTPVYSAQDFLNGMMVMPIAFVIALIIAIMIKETYCESRA